jgi:hypothetical protein
MILAPAATLLGSLQRSYLMIRAVGVRTKKSSSFLAERSQCLDRGKCGVVFVISSMPRVPRDRRSGLGRVCVFVSKF